MRHFGLTGYPLQHSFSAAYFSRKFKEEGINDARFINYPLKESAGIRKLFSDDNRLTGLSITIPHKKSVLSSLDSLDQVARDVGAVNSVKAFRTSKGVHLRGYNTDVFGFSESLREYGIVGGGEAMLLGTGGAASAVYAALANDGYVVTMVSRRRRHGVVTYNELMPEHYNHLSIIVNCTPLGMYPDVQGKPPVDYDLLDKGTLLYDLTYNPSITSFIREGILRGLKAVNGKRMLELQADRSWEIWNSDNL